MWIKYEILVYSGETEAQGSEDINEDCPTSGCQGWDRDRTCLSIGSRAFSLSENQLLLLSNHNKHVNSGSTFRKLIWYPEFVHFLLLLLTAWLGDATWSVSYRDLWGKWLCFSGNVHTLPFPVSQPAVECPKVSCHATDASRVCWSWSRMLCRPVIYLAHPSQEVCHPEWLVLRVSWVSFSREIQSCGWHCWELMGKGLECGVLVSHCRATELAGCRIQLSWCCPGTQCFRLGSYVNKCR